MSKTRFIFKNSLKIYFRYIVKIYTLDSRLVFSFQSVETIELLEQQFNSTSTRKNVLYLQTSLEAKEYRHEKES